MLCQNNALYVLIKLIAATIGASNYSYLRALYNFQASIAHRLSNHILVLNSFRLGSMAMNQLFVGPTNLITAALISIYVSHCHYLLD